MRCRWSSTPHTSPSLVSRDRRNSPRSSRSARLRFSHRVTAANRRHSHSRSPSALVRKLLCSTSCLSSRTTARCKLCRQQKRSTSRKSPGQARRRTSTWAHSHGDHEHRTRSAAGTQQSRVSQSWRPSQPTRASSTPAQSQR
eukprot:755790-Hanusia_phi.AAC.2